MYWRAHLTARRVRHFLARYWARTSLKRLPGAAPSLAVLCVLVVAAGFGIGSVAGGRLADWANAGWRYAAGHLVFTVDGERAKAMLGSVLPPFGEPHVDPSLSPGWRGFLRSWAELATGYDLSSPMSILEAEIGGLRRPGRFVPGSVEVAASGEPSADEPGRHALLSPDGEPAVEAQASDVESGIGAAASFGSVGTGERVGTEALVSERASRAEASGRPGDLLASLAAVDWGDEPRVLIVHSHTSESYVTDPPDPRADPRYHVFNEPDTGITRVGRALAEKLEQVYGIRVIHSNRVHNWPNHWDAYVNSRETVQQILAAYPSIDIVLDVHRQGIENAVWATSVGGVEAVSIEVIYTTSQEFPYASHPHWRRNAAFASVLADAMNRLHPGLLNRVTAVRDRRYNQDLHPHMLLLEVGNYLDREEHAIAAARLLADAVALALYEIEQGAVEALVAPRTVTPPQPPRPAPSSPPPRR